MSVWKDQEGEGLEALKPHLVNGATPTRGLPKHKHRWLSQTTVSYHAHGFYPEVAALRTVRAIIWSAGSRAGWEPALGSYIGW